MSKIDIPTATKVSISTRRLLRYCNLLELLARTGLEEDADRGAFKTEAGAEVALDVGEVIRRHELRIVHEETDRLRIARNLESVIDFEALAADHRRKRLLRGRLDRAVQNTRRQLLRRTRRDLVDRRDRLADVVAGLVRAEDDRRKGEERHHLADSIRRLLLVRDPFRKREVPLVHHDDAGLVRVKDLARDALVLNRRTHHRVQEKNNDVGLFDRLLRTEEREIVDRGLGHLRVRLHARRVNEHVVTRLGSLADRERHLDRIARRARNLRDDDARRIEKTIDVRALARVRTPHNRHAQRTNGRLVGDGRRELRNKRVDERLHAAAVLGRGREDGKPEALEFRRAPVVVGRVALVRRDHARNARLADALDHFRIERRNALARIDNDHADGRVLDRERRLVARLVIERILRHALVERNTARVDEHNLATRNLDLARHAVARHAGLVENNGDALPGNPIEKRALARIRASDERNNVHIVVLYQNVRSRVDESHVRIRLPTAYEASPA